MGHSRGGDRWIAAIGEPESDAPVRLAKFVSNTAVHVAQSLPDAALHVARAQPYEGETEIDVEGAESDSRPPRRVA
jgi:hypothetical protein